MLASPSTPLIFNIQQKGRTNGSLLQEGRKHSIPSKFCREEAVLLPEVSELQVVRHYTKLSQKNFSIDTHFYPLGSCTMKYNPRVCNSLAMLPEFLSRHPYAPDSCSQGFLTCIYELQEMLADITGMNALSLSPMAGAQGEYAGIAMIKKYHESRNDVARTEILVPDAAHGTNPATAAMCNYKVKEIPSDSNGNVDLEALKEAVGPQTAGIMLTNPSTLGVFDQGISEIAKIVHEAGGLLYYDGANLNAILGKVRPGDMGFDVIHLNLHKTFSTPHGGGGPGAGAVGVSERLKQFLPYGVLKKENDKCSFVNEEDLPDSMGRLSTFIGNAGIMLRAYVYLLMLGKEGVGRIAEFSALNANYMMIKLKEAGFDLAFPNRRASHEFIISLKNQAKDYKLSALNIAKNLLDKDYHAPTIYFPLMISECLLIEPTETESKEDIDAFIDAMVSILETAKENPEDIEDRPLTMPVKKLDEVAAVKNSDFAWKL